MLVADRLKPLVRRVLAGDLHRKMREPAVGRGTVPVLYARRDIYRIAGVKANSLLAFLLVPARARDADKRLPAAL